VQELGGSTARQLAKLANGNTPYHRHHAQFMNGGWPERVSYWLSYVWEFQSCPGWEFKIFRLLASHQVMRKIVYSFFCTFIIIIIIISSIIISNISFVVILNCLYLNPQVSPFVHFSSPSHWGEREGVRGQLSGPSCRLPG